ncbi:longitudinals lacking protein, isoforms H/M/V-like [Sitodiplosis mosellana]|uniref:longitudinals lacking protein, isoforms H/M/V-like n=1 Tax=Sitodiplosis mosellana TaxID=263140 RepID=UPI0024440749|nr:longitudinals lacking protein, isoforms H/M/V-like [Sitodiplosis mosellana]XP_055301707.1 longitudinals lacking protein, isoforms H/M/V-like [Sitodiplosis mosellana]
MVEVLCVDPTFVVHFKDRNVAFANGFARLYDMEHQCDLTFLIEGKKLKAHRHVLSFVSKALKEQFDTLPVCDLIEVEWQGASYETVKNVLHYIYHGLVRMKQTELETFVQAAQFMDIATSLQDLNLDAILSTKRESCEIIYDSCGEEFVKGFQKLYTEEKFFDVTLQVEGKELKAHRQALSACSTYFEAMFGVCDINKPLQVLMDDYITYESLQNILRYIYFGEVTVDDAVKLLNIGEILEISGLERADDLVADRPIEGKPNVFQVYSSSKKTTRTIQPVVIKANRPKGLKAMKSRRVVDDSDSEGSIYDPGNDSDNGGMILRRRNLMVTGAKPKKGPNTRLAQKRAINPFAQKKQVKAPAQMVNKARAVPKQPRPISVSRRVQQTNARVKPNAIKQSVDDVPDSMNISLSQEEFDQLAPIYDETDENFDQEEGAVGFSPEYDEEGDEVRFASTTLKRKREDRNNNKRAVGSRAINRKNDAEFDDYNEDNSLDWDIDEQNQCEYGSDDEDMVDSTVSYGENVYVEDLTVGQYEHGQSSQNAWASNDASYADCEVDDQLGAVKVKAAKPKGEKAVGGTFGGRLGIGMNAVPLDDNDYNVEANIIIGPKGGQSLAHGGNRYLMSRQSKDYIRWQCFRRNQKGGRCCAYAYTKDIDGMTLACLPSNDIHNHDPKFTADIE